ncbi:hypothetical protein G7067_00025 [Leucobacter insecticola]|uniref:ECF transporter S component n=1 Tax=Leucobacter insecticola TaxID=2714934 RepID=A0A6G8FG01_9MICO|nr:ECF transporter S component [Leucobacter insecticola]QIM15169.1 hypothetical protein G7067_00025 [Leucobacter insecticola]
MLDPSRVHQGQTETFDQIVLELQELRQTAGPISYAELVRRITEIRIARGVPAAAAIPARSTVYNAFQTGRARMDTELLRDIVVALGADEDAAAQWAERCRKAHLNSAPMAAKPKPKSKSKPTKHSHVPALATSPLVAKAATMPAQGILLLLLGSITLNMSGYFLVNFLNLPLYLDMVGTAIVAILLGPWYGVATAILSRFAVLVVFNDHALVFTFVSVVGALVWGYGIRRFKMGDDFSRFFILNIITAAACTMVATPVLLFYFGGSATPAQGNVTDSFLSTGLPLLGAVFASNIVTSVIDKLISGVIALFVFVLLHTKLGAPAAHMPLVEELGTLRATHPIWPAYGGVILQRQRG